MNEIPKMKESWLCFVKSEMFPFKFFLKNGFQHCFILSRDEYNWYLIDPDWRYLNFKILSEDSNYDFPRELSKKLKVLHIKHKEHNDRNICMPWKLFSCVGIVKYTLGLSFWSLTPYALFKRLKKLESNKICKKYKNIFYVNEIMES